MANPLLLSLELDTVPDQKSFAVELFRHWFLDATISMTKPTHIPAISAAYHDQSAAMARSGSACSAGTSQPIPMTSRLLGYLAVILVNVGIFTAIEGGSTWVIRKHFKKEDDTFRNSSVVKHPFAVPAGYEMQANAVIADNHGATRIVTDNRGRSIVPDPLPNPRTTIVVLGGSSMFGVGASSNAATVPSQLQTALRKEYGFDVNVINLAARGYVSLQELLVLNEYLGAHRVDIVVSVSGHNDQMHYLRGELNPASMQGYRSDAVSLVRKVEAGGLVVSNLGQWLRRISQTANLVAMVKERQEEMAKKKRRATTEDQEVAKEKPEDPSDAANNGLEATRVPVPTFLSSHLANYAMMNAACAAHHAYFKMYFQPSETTKAHRTEEEARHLLKSVGQGSAEKLARQIQAQNRYRIAFDNASKPFVSRDLGDAFGQSEVRAFIDNCHYTEEGAALLARVLAADLAPVIEARRQTPSSEP